MSTVNAGEFQSSIELAANIPMNSHQGGRRFFSWESVFTKLVQPIFPETQLMVMENVRCLFPIARARNYSKLAKMFKVGENRRFTNIAVTIYLFVNRTGCKVKIILLTKHITPHFFSIHLPAMP